MLSSLDPERLRVALAGYAFLLWLNLFRQVRVTAEH
jgi:hypothetical protein